MYGNSYHGLISFCLQLIIKNGILSVLVKGWSDLQCNSLTFTSFVAAIFPRMEGSFRGIFPRIEGSFRGRSGQGWIRVSTGSFLDDVCLGCVHTLCNIISYLILTPNSTHFSILYNILITSNSYQICHSLVTIAVVMWIKKSNIVCDHDYICSCVAKLGGLDRTFYSIDAGV